MWDGLTKCHAGRRLQASSQERLLGLAQQLDEAALLTLGAGPGEEPQAPAITKTESKAGEEPVEQRIVDSRLAEGSELRSR